METKDNNLKSIIKHDEEPVEIKSTFNIHIGIPSKAVLSASEKENGELCLEYADAKTEEWNKLRTVKTQEYVLTCGIYASKGSSTSINIDWNNVESVSGKTPLAIKDFLIDKGFLYDADDSKWIKAEKLREKDESRGIYTVVGKNLPSNLADYKIIRGDTYQNQNVLKNAGYKWDEENKQYIKIDPKDPKFYAKPKDGRLKIQEGDLLPDDLSGINIVYGKTYQYSEKLREEGFIWDDRKRYYIKDSSVKTKLENGILELHGDEFPEDVDLSKVYIIKGNTYKFKSKIKTAGFQWDSYDKVWIKPKYRNLVNDLLHSL